MKKRKLIGLSALFLVLGATGCFGGTETPAKEAGYVSTKEGHYKIDEKGNKIGETEPHVLVDFEGDSTHKPVPATCEVSGKVCQKCEVCGKVVDKEVKPLDHDFVSSTDPDKAATCTRAGLLVCSRCGKTKESGEPLGHRWSTTGEALTEGATDAAVKKYSCTACSAASYEIDVKTGNLQLASGSSWKSGNNPESGAVKLNSDGQSFSFTFNLPKGFTGKMYQRAYMDNYSSNSSKKAFYETDSTANIEVLVNSNKVDLSSQNTVTFEQLFNGEVDGSNTVFKDILLGDVTLGTANTISYKRVKTLNMTVSTFIFVASENA